MCRVGVYVVQNRTLLTLYLFYAHLHVLAHCYYHSRFQPLCLLGSGRPAECMSVHWNTGFVTVNLILGFSTTLQYSGIASVRPLDPSFHS